jgi:hypothetical protein
MEPLPELPVEMQESLYVPAVSYRDALHAIKAFRKSVKGGDAALDTFTQLTAAHGAELSVFAEQLNQMQEELIRMDGLISER